MATLQTVRRWIMTGAVAAITITGTIYGAGLKGQQDLKQVCLAITILSPHIKSVPVAKTTNPPSHTRRTNRTARSRARRISGQEERDGKEDGSDCCAEEGERGGAEEREMRWQTRKERIER